MSPRPDPPEVDRVAAGKAAVAARQARAAVKNAIASRSRTALDAAQVGWTDAGSAEAGMRVRELLTSIPGLGPTRVAKTLAELKISDKKRVGGLGARQRVKLHDYLQRREGDAPAHLVVLAGPTAVGKGTVSGYIRYNYPDVHISVSATTRAPRPGEVDGVHYYFVDDAEFDRKIAAGELLEWATVHNSYRYGTPRPPIDLALEQGRSVLLEIDLQGARLVRAAMPEARLVFLLPPTWEELVRRLIGRGTESPAEQARVLDRARSEIAEQVEFEYVVTLGGAEETGEEVASLIALLKRP
jgi:guanylate kinase